jgi:hypothetical protein
MSSGRRSPSIRGRIACVSGLPNRQFAWSVRALTRRGWIETTPTDLSLTARGALEAQRLDGLLEALTE